jgi:hypothetical protein
MPVLRAALLALLVVSVLSSKSVRADEPLRVALFKTAADDGSLADLANALDPVVSSALSEVARVEVVARPALDLPSMQLAIDCVGETADCLRAAARQAEAESLLAPSVQRDGDAVTVSFLHFDPEAGAARTVKRRYAGERIGEQALSGVDAMLVELFGANEPAIRPTDAAPATAAPEPGAPPPTAAVSAPAPKAKLPIVAIVLGGVGVALIGTSIALGAMANSNDDAYLKSLPDTEVEVDQATAKEDSARSQALVSNITLGLGAAALVGAGVALYWQLKERKSDSSTPARVALSPRVAPRELGLTLTAAWNEGL